MRLPKRSPQRKPRGRHPHHALTPAFIRNVSQPGCYCDGQGLYLDVRPTGSRAGSSASRSVAAEPSSGVRRLDSEDAFSTAASVVEGRTARDDRAGQV